MYKDPQILMCPPDYYEIRPPEGGKAFENDFTRAGYATFVKDPAAFQKTAWAQWTHLKNTIESTGVKTLILDPVDTRSNMVFTADPSLSFIRADGEEIVIFSQFSNVERQAEIQHVAQFFADYAPNRTPHHMGYAFEGTGDNLYDPYRNVFWSGYVPNPDPDNPALGRSDRRNHAKLEALTDVPVIGLEVQRPFFHVDTAMAPLPGGHILCHRKGLAPHSFETLCREGLDRFDLPRAEFLIEVDAADAALYACNLRSLGNTLIMTKCSEDLQSRLRGLGYEVLTCDLSHFIMTGGAVHCLTNNVNEANMLESLHIQEKKYKVTL